MEVDSLFASYPPPRQELLSSWLDERNVQRSDALEIIKCEESGTGIRASRFMDVGEICKNRLTTATHESTRP